MEFEVAGTSICLEEFGLEIEFLKEVLPEVMQEVLHEVLQEVAWALLFLWSGPSSWYYLALPHQRISP